MYIHKVKYDNGQWIFLDISSLKTETNTKCSPGQVPDEEIQEENENRFAAAGYGILRINIVTPL